MDDYSKAVISITRYDELIESERKYKEVIAEDADSCVAMGGHINQLFANKRISKEESMALRKYMEDNDLVFVYTVVPVQVMTKKEAKEKGVVGA